MSRHWLCSSSTRGPGCPPGTTCRTDCRSGNSANPSLWHAAPLADSEPSGEFLGSCQSPWSCTASCAGLELRSLPSTGITRLRRYYGPLRHPARPDSDPRGPSVGGHAPPPCGASRVALDLHVHACRRHYHGGAGGHVARTPIGVSLPSVPKVGLRISIFRGLLSVHSRYGLHARQVAMRPSTSEASAASLPPRLLRLLLAGATVARRESHPLKTDAFHGARDTILFSINQYAVPNGP